MGEVRAIKDVTIIQEDGAMVRGDFTACGTCGKLLTSPLDAGPDRSLPGRSQCLRSQKMGLSLLLNEGGYIGDVGGSQG